MTQAHEATAADGAAADGAAADGAAADGAAADGAAPPGPGESAAPGRWTWGRDRRGSTTWRRGWVLAGAALLLALLLGCHRTLPNTFGNLGSLLETFLPWLGLGVPVLLVPALGRRSATALVALLVPTTLWFLLFGSLLTDKSSGPGARGSSSFTVLNHNVAADNSDMPGTLRLLNGSGAKLVALEELTGTALPAYTAGLAAKYPYHVVEGTVGLWSAYPVGDTRVVDIRIGWTRAFRTQVATPQGPLAVYVAHLPSVRVKFDDGFTAGQRDASAQALGQAVAAEPLAQVLLLGDLNGTMNDRSLAPVTAQLRSAQGSAGSGFGFSWPADFPMARIDQIMSRGMKPTDSWVLPADGSDHRAIAAAYQYHR
ncbi:hypothetical protein C7C46_17810 [Streptomyces tateyamensis]|uniref:Endonuclease/exonuclease/phosphatase domain-containing protein n=1 Tax=Streptomyces tateyamensis TaxID=565073 RepID=A0A2V4NCI8_9ACTN|nr:endonuclease/exonuclease/phosphatase family protein [Streptomyces tateyamensis]PYC77828.1 hypothetical protein C7C46_17810 [Streptomyces tateyamensis]